MYKRLQEELLIERTMMRTVIRHSKSFRVGIYLLLVRYNDRYLWSVREIKYHQLSGYRALDNCLAGHWQPYLFCVRASL